MKLFLIVLLKIKIKCTYVFMYYDELVRVTN